MAKISGLSSVNNNNNVIFFLLIIEYLKKYLTNSHYRHFLAVTYLFQTNKLKNTHIHIENESMLLNDEKIITYYSNIFNANVRSLLSNV